MQLFITFLVRTLMLDSKMLSGKAAVDLELSQRRKSGWISLPYRLQGMPNNMVAQYWFVTTWDPLHMHIHVLLVYWQAINFYRSCVSDPPTTKNSTPMQEEDVLPLTHNTLLNCIVPHAYTCCSVRVLSTLFCHDAIHVNTLSKQHILQLQL